MHKYNGLFGNAIHTRNLDNFKLKFLNLANIFLLIDIAIFLAVYFFMLQRMTVIMGGSFDWDFVKPIKQFVKHYVQPDAISRYIGFFGENFHQDGVNKTAFGAMIGFVFAGIVVFCAILLPAWFFRNLRKQRITHLIDSFVLFAGFVVSIVYSVLLMGDKTCSSLISLMMLILAILYVPMVILYFMKTIIFFRINDATSIKSVKTSAITKSNAEMIFGKLTPEQKLEQNEKNSIEQLVNEDDRSSEFINYNHLNTVSLYQRKKLLAAKRREMLFRAASPWITILIICLPSIIQQLVYSSYSLIDKILAVSYAPHAYTYEGYSPPEIVDNLNLATRYGATISNVILSFMSLITISASILFSYAYGRRSKIEVSKVIGNTILNGVIVSVIVVALGVGITKYLILFQQGSAASTSALDYKMGYWFVMITFFSFPVQMFSGMLLTFLRSEGKAQVTLFILIISCGLNVLFNWLLMSKTDLGLSASAIATLLVYFLNIVLCVGFISYDKNSWIRCRWRDIRITKKITTNIYTFGMASFFQNLALGLLAILSTYLVSSLPTNADDISKATNTNGLVQAYAAIAPWLIIFTSPVFGLTQGARNIMSYCYSAKKYNRIWRFTKIIFWIQVGLFAICCIFVWSIGDLMLKVFIKDPNVPVHHYYQYFSVMSIDFMLIPFSYTAITLYQSLGEANKSFFASSLRAWVIMLPLIILCWVFAWYAYAEGGDGAMYYYVFQFFQDLGAGAILTPMLWNTWKKYRGAIRKGDDFDDIDQQMQDFKEKLKQHKNRIGAFARSLEN